MEVISKYFTTHKRDENDEDIQDSVCVNEEKGRYALSDGVSKSFLPRLLADILTETYVTASTDDTFPHVNLPAIFKKRKEAYVSSLDDFGIAMQEIAEETYEKAAATFVGLEICNQHVSWKVIGDSCLFIIPDKGNIQCICSEKTAIDADGSIHISFGNDPAQIQSDGKIYGNLITGSIKRDSGWYILMSDAISDWFIDRYNNKENVIQRLFALDSNAEFEDLIEEEFQSKRMKNDDCSVILIRVEDKEAETTHQKDEPDSNYFNCTDTKENNISDYSTEKKSKSVFYLFSKLLKILRFKQTDCNNDNNKLHQCD